MIKLVVKDQSMATPEIEAWLLECQKMMQDKIKQALFDRIAFGAVVVDEDVEDWQLTQKK